MHGAPRSGRRLQAAAAILTCALASSAGGATVAGGKLAVPGDEELTILAPAFAAGFPRSAVVSNLGDVDGDRRADLLVTNVQQHGGDAVRSSVLFGGTWPKLTQLPAAGSRGFSSSGLLGAAGDVNGDGRADLVRCGLGGRASTVLFGRGGRRPAAALGFSIRARVDGSCPKSAGDVDGDGFDDLIVHGRRGTAAVVFGRREPAAVDPAQPGASGFRIEAKRNPPVSFAAVGDLNGDRRADLVIDPADEAKRVLVLFGRRRSGTIDPGGLALPAVVGLSGWRGTIASAGDVNGDGVGDLVVGEPRAGRACVVLGRRGRWPATSACDGRRGVVISGAPAKSAFGTHAGGAGDLDRDGFGDVWVSAPSERLPGVGFGGGAVYIGYGAKSTRRIDVSSEPRVVRIAAAPDLNDYLGRSAAAVGDLTGDRRADLVLGGDLRGRAWVLSIPPP